MADFIKLRRTTHALAIVLLGTLLSACGGGEESSSAEDDASAVVLGASTQEIRNSNTKGSAQGATKTSSSKQSMITITGSVIDGPVIDAILTVTDANNAFVATTRSDAQAKYSVQVPANAIFPLTITATGGTNLVTNSVPTVTMVSAVTVPGDATANITPHTTLIVKTAQHMLGGLTQSNLNTANSSILTTFNAGLDTVLVPNPISTPLTELNAASVIKSSEALAETIRRNFSALSPVYTTATQDSLIESVAADMTDGSLDGHGANGADPALSSALSIIFGQVLIESLSNGLKVNGEFSAESLTYALNATFPTSTYTLDELPVNMGILSNIRTSIAAAALIAPSIALTQLETNINSLSAGSLPSEIAAVVPAEMGTVLNEALISVVDGLVGTAHAADTPAEALTLLNIVAASASDYANEGRLPEFAIDGNQESSWTALSMPQWLMIDLGSIQAVSGIDMDIYIASNGKYANYSLDISSDQSAWTTVVSNSAIDTSTQRVQASFMPVPGRYVRLRLDSTNTSDYVNLSEVLVYGEPLPATITSVSASDHANEGRLPEFAIDGDQKTSWTTLSLPQWLMLDLGSIQSVSGINMNIYIKYAGEYANYSIDISSDKSAWTTVVSNSAIDTSTYWAQASFTPVLGRYIRLRLDSTNDSDYANVREVLVYAQAVENSATDSVTPPDADISNTLLTLRWQPNSGAIHGYKVFFGTTADSATTEISDINNSLSTSFNPAEPAIQYDSWYTLRLLPGDSACFKLRVYNADGLSDWSLPVCTTIPQAS